VNALALAVEGAAEMQKVDRQRPFLIADQVSGFRGRDEGGILDKAIMYPGGYLRRE
jgi:hypothetical protein